jgi:hypothetical protein
VEKHEILWNIFDDRINPQKLIAGLSPESKKIYEAVRRCFDENIDEDPETNDKAKYYNAEWLLLLEARSEAVAEIRKANGGAPLVLKDGEILQKLYDVLDANFCLTKQRQREKKKA